MSKRRCCNNRSVAPVDGGGEQGEQGIQGIQGEPGDAATPAQSVWFKQALNLDVVETLLPTQNTFELLNPTAGFSIVSSGGFAVVGSRLQYTGVATTTFSVNWTTSQVLSNGDKPGEFKLFLEGVEIADTEVDHQLVKDKATTAGGCIVLTMDPDEILDLRIKNKGDTVGVYIRSFSMTLVEIV